MRKRVLCLALALVFCLELLPATAAAAEGDFTIENGVLKTYNGSGGDVVIPDGVTEIDKSAFMDCTGLTSVTIPDSVTEIDEYAFRYCTGLTSVTIPDGVTRIGYLAFSGCTGLTDVTIPGSVTEIDGHAFAGCTGLTDVTIPGSVTEIDGHAFAGCTGLTNVVISDGLTQICTGTFSGCTGLTGVTIPDGVTKIGDWAFDGCAGLTSVTIPGSVTSIGYEAFHNCTNLTDIYYGGTQKQWGDIKIDYDYENPHPLESVTIHCTDATITPKSMPASSTAYASTQEVQVDGKSVTFECYALKDESGNATNYIKLRDLADILNGSAAQFQVGWDGAVTITTKQAYTPNGSEGNTPFSGDRAYQETAAATKVNGQAAQLAAFVLNDDAGGGYTYYQLRDLGENLGFNVGWSADKGMFVETDKPYDPNN